MRKTAIYRLLIAACVLGLCLPVTKALGQFPAIELHAVQPCAAQIGKSFEMRLAGSHLEELTRVDLGGAIATCEQQLASPKLLCEQGEGTGVFRVSIDSMAGPGLYDIRAAGRFGFSNPRTLLLTRQPVLRAPADHAEPALAVEMQSGTILLGQFLPQKRSYYRLSLAAGDTLRLAVYANQLDSRATPAAALYDPDRKELARSRAKGYWPAEIQQTVDRDGDYLLAIHDFLYQGGQEYSYVLEAKVGNKTEPSGPLELDELLRPGLDVAHLACHQPPNFGRPTSDLALDATHESSTALRPPFQLQGSFAPGLPCVVRFQAQKGQALWIEVNSADSSQLTDPRLLLYKVDRDTADGQPAQLSLQVEQDDPASVGDAAMRVALRDPRLSWNAPEDAAYRIELHDIEAGERPADATRYMLSVREREPRFELLAYRPFPSNNAAASRPYGCNLMRGGTESIRVLVSRCEGFEGSIEITAENLPEGVSAQPGIIRSGATDGTIILTCTENAASWSGPINIVGRALSETALKQQARTATIAWPVSATHNAVQSRLAQQLGLGVNAADIAPVFVQLGDSQTSEVSQGDKLSLPVKLARRTGGQAACALRPQDVPPKVTIKELTIPGDKSEATLELSVAGDAPPGDYTFWMQNETKVKWRDNPQALERQQDYLSTLTEALAEADSPAKKTELEAAIKTATERVEALKQHSAEKELTVWLPTTAQKIRIVAK